MEVNKTRALEAMAREIGRQLGFDAFDNLGDGESILLIESQEALNLAEIADALLAAIEVEVEWVE